MSETQEKDINQKDDTDQVKPSEIEDQASRMGWVNEDNFRGEKDKWISAEEFVERGETQLPIMKERLKKMDQTVVGLKDTISDMKKTFREFKKYHSESELRQYKKAVRDLTDRQRVAVESSDVEQFDAIEKEKQELNKEMQDKNTSVQIDSGGDDEAVVVFNEWKKDNQWFDDDPELRSYAQNISVHIQNTKGIGGKKLYEEVKKDVKDRFPEKFGNKKRETPSRVVGNSDAPVKNNKHGFSSLPKDAQTECLRFIKTIPGFTKEEYVESYEWD